MSSVVLVASQYGQGRLDVGMTYMIRRRPMVAAIRGKRPAFSRISEATMRPTTLRSFSCKITTIPQTMRTLEVNNVNGVSEGQETYLCKTI